MSNNLSHSRSPYLLQHADNPVEWYEWGGEALNRAKNENKPILVSIGYSACHWCHVMAHESFEDESVASLMNQYFINIKIDREERPDIDHVYMDAVQAMGLRGGWPLNVFLMPDQKPFYGGTYFPKAGWKNLLINIADAFRDHRGELENSSEKFTQSLKHRASEQYHLTNPQKIKLEHLKQAFETLEKRFDKEWGGILKAPKFPMPSIWSWLYYLHSLAPDSGAKSHLLFTLKKMGDGGIYDQIGGGFARYSVDGQWHVPHFEKMLYDNGQLLSLFAQAYKIEKNGDLLAIINQTFEWTQWEMKADSMGYYSALDADSEGEEGKFYAWSLDKINTVAGKDASLIAYYYDVSKNGNWEHVNVLRRLYSDQSIAAKFGITAEELHDKVCNFITKALEYRSLRIRPGLDDKIISGWNGLLLTGFIQAYQATGFPSIGTAAQELYQIIHRLMIKGNVLSHVNTLDIEGFSEDYAAVIQALIHYAETFGDEEAIQYAERLTERLFTQFWDAEQSLFYYSSAEAETLIARKAELFDNVIPSANSMMAENLLKLGAITGNAQWKRNGKEMVEKMAPLIVKEPEYLSQWAIAACYEVKSIPEIVIVGAEAQQLALQFHAKPNPVQVVFPISHQEKSHYFPDKKSIGEKTTIYVCFNRNCQQPVFSVEEALKLLP